MSMRINGEEIVDRGEIWSVKQISSDGVDGEVLCPDGEVEARNLQHAFGGTVWVRKMFVTAGHAADQVTEAELLDMQ